MADIVIYGGSFPGVAAAAKAAANTASSKTIALIVPDPVNHNGEGCCLGSIGTVGGQNFFDIKPGAKYTKGSFAWWFKQMYQHYNTDEMAALLKSDLAKYGNRISYYYGYDITQIGWASPANITSVTVRKIKRNPSTGIVDWETGSSDVTIEGTVFIDASESGKLTRLSNFGGTTGRYDWPASKLDSDERTAPGKARQQVASLMFKVKNFDRSVEELEIGKHANSVYSATGGGKAFSENATIINFNDKYGPQGFMLKPFNMAQNGPEGPNPLEAEWWVNMLLVFNVDGRAYNRDRSINKFPTDMRPDYKTVDDAWVQARAILRNPECIAAMREFPGFKNAELVLDADGMPVVGEVLYLRESIHTAQSSSKRANGTEDTNYALWAKDFWDAGTSYNTGTDKRHYGNRIGLNHYDLDINAYKPSDLKKDGAYIWGHAVTNHVRDDITAITSMPETEYYENRHPTYVPFSAIATNFVYNLLIPGYAASISSLGWSEARVIPNQCVLGDAAGVAAAYAVTNGKMPLQFGASDINAIRNTLTKGNTVVEK